MIGSNTVLSDDPLLTCRLPGLEQRSPVRIVVDGRLRVPLTARVVAEASKVPTWFITIKGGDTARREAFRRAGVELIEVPATPDRTADMTAALRELGRRGLTRVLVEGGATLAAVLLAADLVDRLPRVHPPVLTRGGGLPPGPPLRVQA